MMYSTKKNLTLMVPLTLEAHQVAQQFYQQHFNAQKAKQVYLNTLAVYTVHSYLEWLGVETDLQASDSWNPVVQALSNTADLMVKGQGRLECRPVIVGAKVCDFPPEVWSERIGYVVVQFNSSLQKATLLGFVPSVATESILLSQLRSLDSLLDSLGQATSSEPAKVFSHLSQWLQDIFTADWQAVEELLGLQQLAVNFRSHDLKHSHQSELPTFTTRGKLLPASHLPHEEQVALIVELRSTDVSDLDIWVKVCPVGDQLHLPSELELMVLDEVGVPVMQTQSRQTEMIQLKFQGTPGERFSIQLTLNGISIVEAFVI